ncbi:transcriptional coactivator p15/PC4 family protein [Roseovarius atlanticus]|uniref:transcriptional coactivator p15/PC4 family protein n=1 Tax=Roseovarius atlanticus TaxID=1641875 RepID=UPI001C96E443|nr:transcriptional coactivator p15/PC4 family protein [Roseovarius atlanticus]MBY5987100.1 transcriptional coactivator p15/PC4 family protein [Roseovarius atlanticus]MBY6125740.1 transcriptional coactivator p15/PC4 family protein [Roseovarius atlanticus]MBY6149799.1 transcriptional coactivator p15/PC4 family protein [Roseovarius atlanticus]
MTHIATIRKNAREDLRVTLDEFRGHHLLNLRVWFYADDNEQRPGKQGVAIRPDLLPELRKALLDAEQEANRLGLLDQGGSA